MDCRVSLDRLSNLLAALVMVPGFFVAGVIYVGLFQEASMIGVYMTAFVSAGICLPPTVLVIRGALRLALLLINSL